MSDLLRVLAVFALAALVDEAEQSGVIPRAQEELLHNVFDFADREAGDVMVPEPDVAWLDADLLPEQALNEIAERPYSRYPVGRGSLDRLVIVTLEDVLEEIVGQIEDEYDLPDDTLERVDEHTVRVAGSMTIDDFNETVGTDLPTTDDARTLAGLVFPALGRRPGRGDEVVIGDVHLAVEETDGARITRLLVRLISA